MAHINNDMIGQLLVPFMVWFFFVFGLFGFAVGVGLVICGTGMNGFFRLMNRWISTRRYLNRRWVGILFIVGGGFPLLTLVSRLYENGFDRILGGVIRSPLVLWGVEAVWWSLILSNLLAIAVGTMLILFPAALESIGASVGRWYASPKPGDTEEKMYLTLDHWIDSFPRLSGGIIALGALAIVAQFGMALFGVSGR